MEAGTGVGIGIDGAEDAFVTGTLPPTPVHIHAHGAAIQLDDGAGGGGAINNPRVIEGVAIAFQKKSPGGMAEHGDVFVFHGAADADCHFFLIGIPEIVDRGDGEIEAGEDVIGKIEGAVHEDIDFGAGEDAEAAESGFEFADCGNLIDEAGFIETAGVEGRLRVIRDAEILQA